MRDVRANRYFSEHIFRTLKACKKTSSFSYILFFLSAIFIFCQINLQSIRHLFPCFVCNVTKDIKFIVYLSWYLHFVGNFHHPYHTRTEVLKRRKKRRRRIVLLLQNEKLCGLQIFYSNRIGIYMYTVKRKTIFLSKS